MNTNEVLLVTGSSGSGKTSLIGTSAEWVWEHYKKITRLYSIDGGAYGTKIDALVRLGIIEVFKPRTRVTGGGEGLVEETCTLICEGAWPERVNPETGAVDPGCKLISPITTAFEMYCGAGHLLKKALSERALTPTLCSQCSKTIGLDTAKISRVSVAEPDFERVGAVAFDGITSISDWMMESLAERQGRNELGGEKGAINPIRSGGVIIGSNNRAHYGTAQTAARKWIHRMATIPNLKLPVIVTGLEARSDGSADLALPFYGPSIAGQAMTGKVPQWVGNYLGTQVVIDEKGNKQWRLYLTDYRGEDQVPHKYKTRAEYAGMLPEFLADAPGDPAFSGFSLGKFFDLLEAATTKSMDQIKGRFPDAPGIDKLKERYASPLPAPVVVPPQIPIAPRMAAPTPSPSAQAAPRPALPVAKPPTKPPVAVVAPGQK